MNRINFLYCCVLMGLLMGAASVEAQVGINILQPDTSAILHLESTERGFLPPRMTTQQRDNIVQPKPGLMIYNNTDSSMQYFNGECWLYTWQRNCDDCAFDFQAQNNTGNIDRIYTYADSTQLYINQLVGTAQTIAVYIIPNLPQGINASLSQFTVNGSDTITLTVTADIFAPAGTYPVIVQAVCGNTVGNQVYLLTVEPCIEVDINSPQFNYDLQAANGLPTNVPICVVARISQGVQLTNDTSAAVFSTGTLHPDSQVGIWNEGDLLARGGDGGAGAALIGGGSGAGDDGTHAIELSVQTHLVNNNGRIYAGGGGGGSVGLVEVIDFGIGTFSLGIGAGGGGGSQDGQGGNLGVGLGYYSAGTAATSGMFSIPGEGGELVTPINFNLFGASITLTPNVFGGDGGGYGEPGTSGTLFVNVNVAISIPFVGTVTLFNQNFPDPPPTGFPAGGNAGNAVKRNGNNLIGFGDGYYQSGAIKGTIGN